MGYDAVAVSMQDLKAGRSFLVATQEQGFPWISANVRDKNSKLVFPAYKKVAAGDLQVTIIGLTRQGPATGDYLVEDYAKALAEVLDELKNSDNPIILLSNLTLAENRGIASSYPAIDIIISADQYRGKIDTQQRENTLVCQTSSKGKYIGRMEIEWQGAGFWHNKKAPPLQTLQGRLRSLQERIAVFEKQAPGTNERNKKLSRLTAQSKQLEEEIRARTTLEEKGAGLPQNQYVTGFLAVLPDRDPQTERAITEELKKSRQSSQ